MEPAIESLPPVLRKRPHAGDLRHLAGLAVYRCMHRVDAKARHDTIVREVRIRVVVVVPVPGTVPGAEIDRVDLEDEVLECLPGCQVRPIRGAKGRGQARAAFSASAALLKVGIRSATPVASRLIITVEPGSTTSTILPPRALTALALVISDRMPIEARNLTSERSTTTLFFGADVSSTSCAATDSVPGLSRRPEIVMRRRSWPTSSWLMLDMGSPLENWQIVKATIYTGSWLRPIRRGAYPSAGRRRGEKR